MFALLLGWHLSHAQGTHVVAPMTTASVYIRDITQGCFTFGGNIACHIGIASRVRQRDRLAGRVVRDLEVVLQNYDAARAEPLEMHTHRAARYKDPGVFDRNVQSVAQDCVRMDGLWLAGCTDVKGLDAAMMIHPYDVTTGGAPPTWNREGLELEFLGAPANAGNAEDTSRGVNALEACMLFWNAVNAYRPHIREGARVFGIITEGGTSPNIVPDRAVTRLQIRVPTYPYFLELVERVRNCAKGAALALGAEVKIRAYANRYLAFIPNHTLAEKAYKRGGVTDMGNVSHVCPSIQPYIATAPRGTTWHSAEAAKGAVSKRGYDVAVIGAKALCLTAVDIFTGAVDVEEIRRDFDEAQARLK